MMGSPKVFIIGVGMTKFTGTERRSTVTDATMAREAVIKALVDADIHYGDVKQACVGSVYGGSTCGQEVLYTIGLSGIPIFNLNNSCSTGSSALFLAKQLINDGPSDCVLALGFDKMDQNKNSNGDLAFSHHTAQMYAAAGIEHMKKYGTKYHHFAKIAHKNYRHAMNNSYALHKNSLSLAEILESAIVHEYLTKLQCCQLSDGAAACILANEKFVKKHQLEAQAVEIVGMEMVTDLRSTMESFSMMNSLGYDATKYAANKLFTKTSLNPNDVDVIELNDSFSISELMSYEALGLCETGKAAELIDNGNNTYGGKYVINPSGGLLGRGHSFGATGLAQCIELCWQLRGIAENRQMIGAKLALQHNIGIGDSVIVALYRLGFLENPIIKQLVKSKL